MKVGRRYWLVLGTAASLAGCAAEGQPTLRLVPEGPWETVEGEFLSFHARPGDPLLCPAYVARAEARVSLVWDRLGVVGASRPNLRWYQFPEGAFTAGAAPCEIRDKQRGCAIGDYGYGTARALDHELIHMALSAVGSPPPLLMEGSAVAAACSPDPTRYLVITPFEDWRAYLHHDAANGWPSTLVVHLVTAYGPERFLELYAAVPHDAGSEEMARSFEDIYGITLDEVWENVVEAPGPACFPWMHCHGALPAAPRTHLGRACDKELAVRLPQSPAVVTIDDGGLGTPWPCTDVPSLPHTQFFWPDRPVWTFFGNEEYALRYGDDWPVGSVAITPRSDVLVESCDDAVPISVHEASFLQRALLVPTLTPLYIALQLAGPYQLSWSDYTGRTNEDYSWHLETCLGCEEGQGIACTSASTVQDGLVWLKVVWSPTEGHREPLSLQIVGRAPE